MFDGVAERYDLTNGVLTFGLVNLWRRQTRAAVDPRPGEMILDLAAGTGSSSVPLDRSGATVVACDLSFGMLAVGKQRHPEIDFVAGDALRLPFADDSFDAISIDYGLRNVEDTRAALRELRRVARPGGRLVITEFSSPVWAPVRVAYQNVALGVLPQVARRVSSNPSAYEYLAESIQAWPDQQALAAMMTDCGWRDVAWRNLTGGIVAVHRGVA